MTGAAPAAWSLSRYLWNTGFARESLKESASRGRSWSCGCAILPFEGRLLFSSNNRDAHNHRQILKIASEHATCYHTFIPTRIHVKPYPGDSHNFLLLFWRHPILRLSTPCLPCSDPWPNCLPLPRDQIWNCPVCGCKQTIMVPQTFVVSLVSILGCPGFYSYF